MEKQEMTGANILAKAGAAALSTSLLALLTAGAAFGQDLTPFNGVTAQGGPTAQMFPIFMAQEMGYYEEEGLDVTLNYSKGSSDAARQLAAGNVDWGIFSSAATMQTVQRGFPLKAIMQVYYPDTFDIVVPEESEVQTMADMAGLTIGLSDLAGGEVPMTRASIVSSGLAEGSDVRLVVAGEGDPTTVRSFEEGRIQAYAGAKRDLLLLPAQGIATRSITPEVIAQFPGDALAVRLETYEADPELLAKFVRATLKGWSYGMTNPDDAFELLRTEYAAASLGDNPVAAEFWALVQTYYTAPEAVELHGEFVPEAWEIYMEYLQLGEGEQKALAGPVDLSAVLTDDIVEAAWDGLELP
ncbi:NitT/TauT family transport system substrate-binding protein [Pelagibacterium halotolerans]|uniref:ABC transporter, periplasmic binding protein n=2 Tax=Pelagibacterium TaxID=1082930 RepID=G4R658_PELHB|nr:ABC transporter, periplasmic binding protein [Pelagibacterium halotolerans B2]SDZ84551.1 NitT/TauT family transport system substrate-binding protein [Pelagibacterium halotolerans]